MASGASPNVTVPPEVLYDEIATAIQHMQLLSYFDVISSVVVVYDAVITMGLEVELIWKSSWSLLKIVYLVQKYLPFIDTVALGLRHQFADNLSSEACFVDYNVAGYMFILGVTLSEVILTWRVWAVWRMNNILGFCLAALFIAIFVPVYVIAHIFLASVRFSPAPFSQPGCFITAGNPILWLLWVLLMIYDIVVLVLMSIRGIRAYSAGGNSELSKTIYGDGVLYYVYQLIVSVLNVAFTLTLPADLTSILTSTGRAMQAVLTSRVLLHIRQQSHADVLYADPALGMQAGASANGMTSHSTALEFASVQTYTMEI